MTRKGRSRDSDTASANALEPLTPAMVKAGLAVLWRSGAVEEQLDSDADLVSEIYQAMLRARS
jgi:hypothetical protein